MRARAPASAANLGPGFDTLAVALTLYTQVEVTPAASLQVTTFGEGSELPADANHLAARVVTEVLGHDRVAISVRSNIPVGRGLGSSAALAVAAAAAAGAPDPLGAGSAIDGHPENAAASVLGGLVTATIIDAVPVARRLPLDEDLRFVVIVPARPLPTAEARAALPERISHDDAAFNLGRLGLLIAGLADHHQLLPAAGEDRLHQDYRAALFPEAAALLDGLRQAGALLACWSGAGPSLLAAVSAERAERLAADAQALVERADLAAQVLNLEADRVGVTAERSDGQRSALVAF